MSEPSNKLKYIFDNVNNWLKFAESKNAALLAANSAIVFGLIRTQDLFENSLLHYYFVICIVLATFSACICLLSFVPKIKINSIFQETSVQAENLNLLFYGHIAKFTPEDYLKALQDGHIITEEAIQDRFCTDIANQIVVNSKIAQTKYIFFQLAIWFTVAAVISPIVTIIIALTLYANEAS